MNSKPPSSEQAMSAEKYPGTYRHPTAADIKIEVDAWKQLSVTAIAAENLSVAEYVKELESRAAAAEKDAQRYRWLRTAGAWESEIGMDILCEKPESFDAAIDAAIDAAMGDRNETD